jgi:hypothetical protein
MKIEQTFKSTYGLHFIKITIDAEEREALELQKLIVAKVKTMPSASSNGVEGDYEEI